MLVFTAITPGQAFLVGQAGEVSIASSSRSGAIFTSSGGTGRQPAQAVRPAAAASGHFASSAARPVLFGELTFGYTA